MANDGSPTENDRERAARIAHVIEDIAARRLAGKQLADQQIIAEHPELMPELAEELAVLGGVLDARRRAAGRKESSLTRRAEGSETVPDNSAAASHGARAVDAISGALPGYQILRELHRGGQGVVYQAVQRSTKRKVAVKFLLEGSNASDAARKRFQREIELVAQLKHANIVAIFDSGETADGRQYCVMDYIRGVPLDRYVREHKLTLEETLQLFASVCEPVNYAHQKGVIHRDLKPSNILVEEPTGPQGHEDKPRNRRPGVPRILDFGLAKQLAGPVETLISLTGQVLGTLPYLSPEQVRGNPDLVDIRTDVYALGVLLYQLLTGHFPYPVAGQMADVLKHIAETEPTPPRRTWKSESGVTRRSVKRLRSGQCPIDDEVQTIVLRTLAKERERRYQTAGELARDIQRYLTGEPVEAKRDSGWYVLRKAIRRHRAAVAVASVFLGMLIAFSAVMTVLYDRARRAESTLRVALEEVAEEKRRSNQAESLAQRRRLEAETAREAAEAARRGEEKQRGLAEANEAKATAEADWARKQSASAQAIQGFLENMLAAADRGEHQGREVTVREMLDRASEELAALEEQPEVEAAVRNTLGLAYQALGKYSAAEEHFRAGVQILRGHTEHGDRDLAIGLNNLSGVLRLRGKLDEAESLARDALERLDSTAGAEASDRVTALSNLAAILAARGKLAEAEERARAALGLVRDRLGEDHPRRFHSINILAVVLRERGSLREALRLRNEALALAKGQSCTLHPDVVMAMNNLAGSLSDFGRHAEAGQMYREALALLQELRGEEHPDVASAMNNLAVSLERQSLPLEAESMHRRALEMRRRLLGPDHPNVAASLNNLASVLERQSRHTEAEPLYRECLRIAENIYGDAHPRVAITLSNLGRLLCETNQLDEAERSLRRALAIFEQVHGPGHKYVADTQARLAHLLFERGSWDEADKLYGAALASYKELDLHGSMNLANVYCNSGVLAREQGRLKVAEERFIRALEMLEAATGNERQYLALTLHHFGILRFRADKYAEAVRLFRRALIIDRELYGERHVSLATDIRWLAAALQRSGAFDEAERHYREALEIVRDSYGPQNAEVADTRIDLGALLLERGKTGEAVTELRAAVRTSRIVFRHDDEKLALGLTTLAASLLETGENAEAETLLRESLSIRSKREPSQDAWRRHNTQSLLGAAIAAQGRYDEAENLLLAAARGLREALNSPKDRQRDSLQRIVELYGAWGKEPQATRWRDQLDAISTTATQPASEPRRGPKAARDVQPGPKAPVAKPPQP